MKDVEISKWEINPDDGTQTRELKCMIKLVNVPLQNSSRMYKVQTVQKIAETYKQLYKEVESYNITP